IAVTPRPVVVLTGETKRPSVWREPIVSMRMAAAANVTTTAGLLQEVIDCDSAGAVARRMTVVTGYPGGRLGGPAVPKPVRVRAERPDQRLLHVLDVAAAHVADPRARELDHDARHVERAREQVDGLAAQLAPVEEFGRFHQHQRRACV